jgi:hypothetical protein
MTVPTGEGQKQGIDAAGTAGTPLASRPERAIAHYNEYKKWDYDSRPDDRCDDAVVDMKADPVT